MPRRKDNFTPESMQRIAESVIQREAQESSSGGYQGYANYETWAYSLWLNNEQGSYQMAVEAAEELGNVQAMAEWLEDWAEADKPQIGGFWGDVCTNVLQRIDFEEVAEEFQEFMTPEVDEDEY